MVVVTYNNVFINFKVFPYFWCTIYGEEKKMSLRDVKYAESWY